MDRLNQFASGQVTHQASNCNQPERVIPTRAIVIGAGITVLVVSLAFWWLCRRNEVISFLAAAPGAEWIVYSTPIEGATRRTYPLSTEFLRSLNLETAPAKATLTVRAFRTVTIAINGQIIPLAPAEAGSWKTPLKVDVTGLIRAGTNLITAWVTNTAGPPALWLRLKAGGESLYSDERWQSSQAGAAWRPARLVRLPAEIMPSDPHYGSERTIESLGRAWKSVCAMAAICLSVVLLIGYGFRSARLQLDSESVATRAASWRTRWIYWLLGATLLARAALFVHDMPLLPRMMGFDAVAHEAYARLILKDLSLPLPGAGWETHQPPLYYTLSAVALGVSGLEDGDKGYLVLRGMNGIFGLAHCWLAFLCLRLLFPSNLQAQAVGLLVAAFLPFHVYQSQYATNDPLAGLLVTSACYFCLRALQAEMLNIWWYAGVGLALGAAVLTKLTAVLALPLFPLALGLDLWRRRIIGARDCLRTIGVVAICFLAICGWHFVRVWMVVGAAPLPGWETDSAAAWWQDPGFRVVGFYCRFGEALVSPFFSAHRSFADGIYSTLWGDGMISGVGSVAYRPPWNYDLMNVGYLLSAPLSLLLVIGLVCAARRFVRTSSPEWLLIAGMLPVFGLGIAYISLRNPWLSVIKAFYAFPALLSFSALVALGFCWTAQRNCCVRICLWALLLLWAITVCSSFWIKRSGVETQLVRSICLALGEKGEPAEPALREAIKASEATRQSEQTLFLRRARAEAYFCLGVVLDQQNRTAEAIAQYRESIRIWDNDPYPLNNLAWLLATNPADDVRNGPQAVQVAERACSLTQDRQTAFIGTLAAAYAAAGRFADAAATAQRAVDCANLRHEDQLAKLNQQFLEIYRANKPFIEGRSDAQR